MPAKTQLESTQKTMPFLRADIRTATPHRSQPAQAGSRTAYRSLPRLGINSRPAFRQALTPLTPAICQRRLLPLSPARLPAPSATSPASTTIGAATSQAESRLLRVHYLRKDHDLQVPTSE